MRRVFLGAAIAAAIPAVVVAITTTNGQLVEVTTYNTTTQLSYVNAAMCTGGASIQLQWTINGAFLTTDTVNVYASNKAPGTDGYCAEASVDSTQAASIGGITTPTSGTSTLSVTAAAIKTASGIDCATASEALPFYVCAHWKAADGTTKKGRANGIFHVQTAAPDAPTGVTVEPGSRKLVVRWTANDSTPTAATRYEARAYVGTATTPVSTAGSTGTSATIAGLENGTEYGIEVVAFSVGGNPSAASSPRVAGRPIPTAGFWDVYDSTDGVEQGGCASGPGGVASLLAVASLLVLRRRKP